MNNETTLKLPNYVDQTVHFTPEPRACSTEAKHRREFIDLKRAKPLNFDGNDSRKSEGESIGVLTISDIDIEPELEVPRKARVTHSFSDLQFNNFRMNRNDPTMGPNSSSFNDITAKLKQQRELAHATINKVCKLTGLPPRLVEPSNSYWLKSPTINPNATNSTVSESDLLKTQTPTKLGFENTLGKESLNSPHARKSVCNPNASNMPRSVPMDLTTDARRMFPGKISAPKCDVNKFDVNKETVTPKSKFLREFEELQEQCQNPDLSFKEIFEKLKQFGTHSTFIEDDPSTIESGDSRLDSKMFMPAELATDKFLAEELSWRKEFNDVPVNNRTSITSQQSSPASTFGEKSMGEFFKGKSDECSLMFSQSSPPRHKPVPLIDNSEELSLSESFMSDDVVNRISLGSCRKSMASNNSDTFSDSIAAIQHFIAGYEETPRKMVEKLLNVMDSQHTKSHSKSAVQITTNTNQGGASKKLPHNNTQFDKIKPNDVFYKYRNARPSLSDYGQSTNNIQNSKQYASTGQLAAPHKTEDVLGRRSMKSAKSSSCISQSNKENSRHTPSDRSLTSVRSASSMDILPEGKLPIECTRTELVWGCVKLGKTVSQDFMIRNRYRQKLRMQVSCTNPNYKISKTEVEPVGTVTVLLHPLESRQFTVTFTPMSKGAHIGKLNFYPIIKSEIQKAQRQLLMLYGYGGHACMDFQNVSKDSAGKIWLSFGYLDDNVEMVREFIVRNTGTLPGFAHFEPITKLLGASTNLVKIEPNKIVLKPGNQSKITVIYQPQKDERKNIQNYCQYKSNSFEFAYIKCTMGDEAIRGRLRRICNKIVHDDLMDMDDCLYNLSKPIEFEIIPDDINMIKESVAATKELLHQLHSKEIMLNIECDNDKTLMPDGNTSSFHTLANNQTNLSIHEAPRSHTTTVTSTFTVEPSIIFLTPPNKYQDSILLTSENVDDMHFEVILQPEGIIEVDTRSGVVRPGETFLLTISCRKKQSKDRQNVRVMIYAENDVSEVEVKVINLKQVNMN